MIQIFGRKFFWPYERKAMGLAEQLQTVERALQATRRDLLARNQDIRDLREALYVARSSGFQRPQEGDVEIPLSDIMQYRETRTDGRGKMIEIEANVVCLLDFKFLMMLSQDLCWVSCRGLRWRATSIHLSERSRLSFGGVEMREIELKLVALADRNHTGGPEQERA